MKIHGGAQRQMLSISLVLSFLIFLSLLFFLILVYAILQDNQSLLQPNYRPYLKFKLLDIKTSATIFVSLIGLILVRYHFQLGFMPRLVSETRKTKKAVTDFINFGGELIQVKVRNVGSGAATILSYKFRLNTDTISEEEIFDLDFLDVVKTLCNQGLKIDKDYYLSETTAGYTLPTKDESLIVEIGLSSASKIKQLDLRIEFSGQLGGKYFKDVFLIPRLNLTAAEQIESD